jgi:hypothetical protein
VKRITGFLKSLGPGSATLDMTFGPVPLSWLMDDPAPPGRAPLPGPAPGHPERLAPEVPPTPVERDLWNRLTRP